MMVQGVLLDKDGTILDYHRTWVPINVDVADFAARGDVAIARDLLRLGGQDPDTGAIVPGSVLAAGTHDEVAAVFAAHLGSRTPPQLGNEIERLFREGTTRHSVLVNDVRTILAELAALGLVIGLATNDSVAGLHASLGQHEGILDHFEFLAGCDSGYGIKPAPGMVLAFCDDRGLKPHQVAVVGDAVHDLEMGRRAGAGLNIGVLGGTSPREELAAADCILETLAELPGAIMRHNANLKIAG